MSSSRHIVAASGLVTNGDGKILLVKNPWRGWEIPGGQIEEGETIPQGLQREIQEEAGVTVRVGALAAIYSNVTPPTKIIFGYLCEYVSGKLQTSPESLEVAWFDREKVLDMIPYPSLHNRARDLLHFNGRIKYTVYTIEPYQIQEEYFY